MSGSGRVSRIPFEYNGAQLHERGRKALRGRNQVLTSSYRKVGALVGGTTGSARRWISAGWWCPPAPLQTHPSGERPWPDQCARVFSCAATPPAWGAAVVSPAIHILKPMKWMPGSPIRLLTPAASSCERSHGGLARRRVALAHSSSRLSSRWRPPGSRGGLSGLETLQAVDLCRSIHCICSASTSQPLATSSNAFFTDRFFVCAARFLASAAFCRYMSARDDMKGEQRTERVGSSGVLKNFQDFSRWDTAEHGEHRGSTANCSSLASMSARPPWQNPWRGEGSQQVIGVGGRVVRIAILQSGRV
jgi:hypothetical protein